MFSRTIQRLEPSRRHDTVFLNTVKGLPWDVEDGILRGRPRKESAPPPILVAENSQTQSPDLSDNTADNHSESPKEPDDTNDTDNVSMSETPVMVAIQATSSPGHHWMIPLECDIV